MNNSISSFRQVLQRLIFAAGLLFLLLPGLVLHAKDDFPAQSNPPKLVNDFAGLLNEIENQTLEQKLLDFETKGGNQIAVVTVKNIGDYEISDYAVQLGQKWQIGDKEKDNGVLVLVAAENRKIFIATGYGAEAALTDALSRRIIEEIIKPNFKEANYFIGLNQATNQIMVSLAPELVDQKLLAKKLGKSKAGDSGFFLLLGLFIFFYILMNLGNLSSSTYGRRRGYNGPIFLPGGFGSGHSYGDFSSGGGGFGGFGGGDFGGGGAGGSW